jgi:hypothetical protein
MELGFEGRSRGRSNVWIAAVVIPFLLFAISVYSQNLVLNGNFGLDGGSFADWQISHPGADTNCASYSPMISEGGADDPAGDPYYAQFLNEENGGSDLLSQDVSTIPGDIYTVNFYAEDGAGHNVETDFNFGDFTDNLGNSFATGPGEWLNGWTNFSFTVTATTAETDLSFLVNADSQSEFGVTGISVTAVPQLRMCCEGEKFSVTVTNCTASVVIQASTDMANWVSVCTNTAPYTFSESCKKCAQRFYRAMLVKQ